MGVSIRPPIGAQRSGHRALQTIQQALVLEHLLALSYSPARAVPNLVPSGAQKLPKSRSFFRPLFRSLQKSPPASKRVIQGAPRESPKHQNPVKIASRTGVRRKGWKRLRKSVFSGELDMQSAHACAVQTHFFLFALRPEK